jgi:hypothetical protein
MATELKDPALAPRMAQLKLAAGPKLTELVAEVPAGLSSDELGRMVKVGYDVISKLTAHPCLSGRIRMVIDERMFDEVINVNLATGARM